jgi:hypothetical protein
MQSQTRRGFLVSVSAGGLLFLAGCANRNGGSTPTSKPTTAQSTQEPTTSQDSTTDQTETSTKTSTEEPETKSPEEIRECLPEYDEPPADEDEQLERADEISEEIYDCLDGHDWFWSSGRGYNDENNEWYVVVNVYDRDPAEEHVPQDWGGVPIRIRVGEPPEPE